MKQQPQTLNQLKKLLLDNRNLSTKAAQDQFFDPISPMKLMPSAVEIDRIGLHKSVQRLLVARENQELVVIYGDYDADGMSATAIAWRILNDLGWRVMPFIPDRQKHGYGLSRAGLKDLLNQYQPKVILTVDNGVVAHREVVWTIKQGIDVILTDHHQPELNKREQPIWPETQFLVHTTKLCGASVAWMLMKAVVEKLDESNSLLLSELDLCGLATIADQVKLIGANRSFAKFGLESLKASGRLGLKTLYKLLEIDPAKISVGTVGFVIAPRINAVGRMAHGLTAVRLLCTQNKKQALALARELNQLNSQRQDLVANLVELARSQALAQADEKLLFISGGEYHEGVIGLVAGKLCEEFHKPCIVAGILDSQVKGSARSVKGVNITAILRQAKSLLTSVGGHPAAAGFSASQENLEKLQQQLQQIAREQIDSKLLTPQPRIECQLPAKLLNLNTVKMLMQFEPFGVGNPRPIFEVGPIQIAKTRQFGKINNHQEFSIKLPGATKIFDVISWNHAPVEEVKDGDFLPVKLEQREWRNNKELSIIKQ